MHSHPAVEMLQSRIAPAALIVGIPTLSIADVTHAEGNDGPSAFAFTVSLNAVSATDVTVDYATSAGSASDASDFAPAAGTLTIPAGLLSGTVQVMVNGDTTSESNETFNVTLSNASANAAIADGTAVGTVLNDDPTVAKAKIIKYMDPDGDLVTIRVDVGTLGPENVVFVPRGPFGGLQLEELNLSGSEFVGANVSITAQRGPNGGDGFASLGYLNASGSVLGIVDISGDVGRVDAFNVDSLTVHSMGRLGLSTQADGGSLLSTFNGGLRKLVVKGDVMEASIFTSANIGSISIRGDLIGGAEDHSGTIEAGGRIGSITINGSLVGGDGEGSGAIFARKAGSIQIRSEILGGTIALAGAQNPFSNADATALASLNVGGNVSDASVFVGYDHDLNPVNADVRIGAVTIGGDWVASNLVSGATAGFDGLFGTDDDTLIPDGSVIIARIASIAVRGQILGTVDSSSDSFGFVTEKFGSFKVGKTFLPFTADRDTLPIGPTSDVAIVEAPEPTPL